MRYIVSRYLRANLPRLACPPQDTGGVQYLLACSSMKWLQWVDCNYTISSNSLRFETGDASWAKDEVNGWLFLRDVCRGALCRCAFICIAKCRGMEKCFSDPGFQQKREVYALILSSWRLAESGWSNGDGDVFLNFGSFISPDVCIPMMCRPQWLRRPYA